MTNKKAGKGKYHSNMKTEDKPEKKLLGTNQIWEHREHTGIEEQAQEHRRRWRYKTDKPAKREETAEA